jgi:protein O-mannosyl-transferase
MKKQYQSGKKNGKISNQTLQQKKSYSEKQQNSKNLLQSTPQKKVKTSTILIWLFIICTLSVIAYSPTFKNEVTNWDDDKYITENPYFKKLDGENLKKIFSDYYMGNYHPLAMLTLTTDYLIAGRDEKGNIKPWMFHLVNILLHLVSTILVFWFVYLLFKKFEIAVVAGLLFGIHTLHVESVVWISERKDVLYTAFFVASLVCYVQYIRMNKILYFALSLLLYVLSLLSKGQAVSLAVTLVAIDYFMGRKLISSKVILEKLPFFVLAAVFGVIAILAQKAGEAIHDITDYEFYKRIGFAGYGFSEYLIKLILPVNLSAIYPYPDIINRSIPSYYWLFMIPTIATIFLFYYSFKKSKEVFFSLAFFIINIFLLLQLIPVGSAVYADRYAYIPSIGFCILGGLGYQYVIEKKTNLKLFINIVLTFYLITLGVLTFQRTQKWKSSYILWDDVVTKEPKAVVAWNNRGSTKDKAKDHAGAIEDFTRAIEGKPDYTHAYYNRGTAKKDLGTDRNDKSIMESAILDFDRALELNPKFSEAYHNRGITKDNLGDQKNAIIDFDKAIEFNPRDPNPYVNRGVAKGKTGRFKEAVEDFNWVIQQFPNNASAYSNRGLARDLMGDSKGAISDYNKAIEMDPKFVVALTNRGIAKRKLKDLKGAIDDFSLAIAVDPKTRDSYYFRGLCFLDLNNKDAACNDFNTAGQAGHPLARQMFMQNCQKK